MRLQASHHVGMAIAAHECRENRHVDDLSRLLAQAFFDEVVQNAAEATDRAKNTNNTLTSVCGRSKSSRQAIRRGLGAESACTPPSGARFRHPARAVSLAIETMRRRAVRTHARGFAGTARTPRVRKPRLSVRPAR